MLAQPCLGGVGPLLRRLRLGPAVVLGQAESKEEIEVRQLQAGSFLAPIAGENGRQDEPALLGSNRFCARRARVDHDRRSIAEKESRRRKLALLRILGLEAGYRIVQ